VLTRNRDIRCRVSQLKRHRNGEVKMSKSTLTNLEARVILAFVEDQGMEYLFEYADDYEVDIDALIDKLKDISESE